MMLMTKNATQYVLADDVFVLGLTLPLEHELGGNGLDAEPVDCASNESQAQRACRPHIDCLDAASRNEQCAQEHNVSASGEEEILWEKVRLHSAKQLSRHVLEHRKANEEGVPYHCAEPQAKRTNVNERNQLGGHEGCGPRSGAHYH